MGKKEIDPDGWASFWIPAGLAILLFLLIGLLAWSETRHAIKQVEQNVDKKFDQLQTVPVNVPKYDSLTKNALDSIELHRQISHDHVDNLYDSEIQNVLDTLYNKE